MHLPDGSRKANKPGKRQPAQVTDNGHRRFGSFLMSTMEEVRATRKRVQELLEALTKAEARDPKCLCVELQRATDEYAAAVRKLAIPPPTPLSVH
jgi:DNA-binding LacI/PurR family transcriptional regulator